MLRFPSCIRICMRPLERLLWKEWRLRSLLPAMPSAACRGKAASTRLAALVFFIAACTMESALLAAEPIDTDGPDFVESSEVVGKGRFQYEADLQLQRNRGTFANDTTSTPLLLKYGITEQVELRMETEGRIWIDGEGSRTGAGTVHGNGDTALGLKWHSQDREVTSGTPAVSWLLHFDTPSGSSGLKGQGIRPSLRSVVTWELPKDFALGVMPGVKYDTAEDGHRYLCGILGVVLNKHITEKVRAFVEMAALQVAHARDEGTHAYWDVGAAYLINDDTQLGFRAGVGANRATPSSYVLVELAQRF